MLTINELQAVQSASASVHGWDIAVSQSPS